MLRTVLGGFGIRNMPKAMKVRYSRGFSRSSKGSYRFVLGPFLDFRG